MGLKRTGPEYFERMGPGWAEPERQWAGPDLRISACAGLYFSGAEKLI